MGEGGRKGDMAIRRINKEDMKRIRQKIGNDVKIRTSEGDFPFNFQ
jgi:formylmethanofuran dehydrogenase subunit D